MSLWGKVYTSVWLFLSVGLALQGQNYSKSFYSTDDGLPSNESYSVVQDSIGYIWVSTDRGVSRYNGHEFKNYGIDEGLHSTVIYKLLVSPLGGVVFYSADNRLGNIRNDSIIYFTNDTTTLIQSIYPSEKGIVVGYRNASKYELISWSGELLHEKKYDLGFYVVNDSSLGCFLLGKSNVYEKQSTYICPDGKLIDLDYLNTAHHQNYFVSRTKNHGIIANTGILNVIDDNGKQEQRLLSGTSTGGGFFGKEERLWLGLFDRGVEVISLKDKSDHFRLMEGYSVSSVLEDKEGNVWLTTLKNGLIKLRESNYSGIAKGKIKSIVSVNDMLYASCDDTTLLRYDLKTKEEQRTPLDFRIADLLVIQDTLFVSADRRSKLQAKNENIRYITLSNSKLCNYQNYPVGIIYGHLHVYKNKKLTSYPIHDIEQGYTYSNHVYRDTAYAGRPKGLYQVFKDGDKISSKKVLNVPVTNMCFSPGEYLFATKGHGIFITDESFSIKEKISSRNGLSGNFVSYLEQFRDSMVCGTNRGVNLISNYSDNSTRKVFSSFRSDGLWSGNVTDMLLYNKELYVGTQKGIQKISLNNFDNAIDNPTPILESLNGKKVIPGKLMFVEAGSDVISIGLNHIFFHGSKNFSMQYRLLGQDSTWISTNSSQLEFLNLTPGNYEFQYRSKLAQNELFSLASVKFELQPMFIQTDLFKFLMALAIVSLIAFVIFIRDRQLKVRAHLLIEQEQLRFKALTSQLNPHFMFNALGSIQQLIISKKNDLAAEYLASFSGLINMMLKNTDHLFIPLADEMEFINEYVEVEKSRFERPFEFNWHISSALNKMDVLVPTMLLQPFVENAIIHGINPLNKVGVIEVFIKPIDNRILEIKIKDNGIGVASSNRTKSKRSRKSMAMENIKTRIKTMEKMYKNTFHQHIEELVDEKGAVLGAMVLIHIPHKLKSSEAANS